MTNNRLSFDFAIKGKEQSGKIVIAGFANANTVDRGIERIDPKAWKLDNYVKNPVVLFNHGIDAAFGAMPIGRAKKVEARDGGLFAEIEISDSKTEKITAIRDLIEEGILKTFSVGFDPKNANRDGETKIITDAELLEISVVPIPMNQDSTFSLLSKSLGENRTKTAKKWLARYQKGIRQKVIDNTKKELGCSSLILLNLKLAKEGFKDLESAQKLAKQFGYAVDKVSEDEKHFIFKQSDAEYQDSILINLANNVQAEVKGQKMEVNEEEKPKEGEEKLPSEDAETKPIVTDEELPKEGEEDPEIKAELTKEDIDASVSAWHDEAMACAANEGEKPSWVTDAAAWDKAKEAADLSYSRDDPEKYYSVVSWLYLNKFQNDEIEPMPLEESKGCGNKEDEKEIKSAPIPTGSNAVDNNTSPALDLSRQTNVLLGALISEVQRLNQSMEKLVVKPMESGETETMTNESEESEEEAQPLQDDEEMKSFIARIRKNQDDLNMRLKSFQ
jgi:HK97 family phage prohead protease